MDSHEHRWQRQAARPFDDELGGGTGGGEEAATEVGELGRTGVADDQPGVPLGDEPTRFGDWEKKGRCIDF